jgi:hypothetical protein
MTKRAKGGSTATGETAGDGEAQRDVVERVRTWLDEEGYTFELTAGRQLSMAGWDAKYQAPYVDPETKKMRTIDLVGSIFRVIGDHSLSVELVVECKRLRGKPWVIFGSDDSSAATMGTPTPGLFARHAFVASGQQLKVDAPTLFGAQGPRTGHTAVRALIPNQDEKDALAVRAALLSAASATMARTANRDLAASLSSRHVPCALSMPVVLVEGDLVFCELDPAGGVTLERVNRARVVTPWPGVPAPGLLISLVTAAAWWDFVSEALAEAQRVAATIELHGGDLASRYSIEAARVRFQRNRRAGLPLGAE